MGLKFASISFYYTYFRCKNSVLQIDHFLVSETNLLKY